MIKINQKYINQIVRSALREDLFPSGDITSNLLNNNFKIKAKIICNENAVIAGMRFSKAAFELIDKKIIFKARVKEGSKIKKGCLVATISGRAKSIFKSERVALNFLGLASGVATQTMLFAKAINGAKCKICCTRKTLPNLRLLQKYAVNVGGGFNHRFNLSDEFLIKDNHIASLDIKKLIILAIKKKNKKKITVEVDSIKQLKKILGLKFNRVIFDNMNIKNLKAGIKMTKKKYETEASGNVNIKNIKKIAITGVDRISVGKITHSSPNIDLKLEL